MATRLSIIMAAKADCGVILRRGPTNQVQLIKWNTLNDTFEYGQWFKGRIYEDKCDLSPSGNRFIYLASKHKGKYETWTAVSRPPYLTALAFWPKSDTFGGGGVFKDEDTILLNHYEKETIMPPEFHIPKKIKVIPVGKGLNLNYNEQIDKIKSEKSGWKLFSEGKVTEDPGYYSVNKEKQKNAKMWWIVDPPHVFTKEFRFSEKAAVIMEYQIKGYHVRNGPSVLGNYLIKNTGMDINIDLGEADWADWDKNGNLLYSKEGKLFRLKQDMKLKEIYDIDKSVMIADFSGLKFKSFAAPIEAIRW